MVSTEPLENFNPKLEVVSCHIEHAGKLLLLQRQSHKPQGGTWGVPAGKVDGGEDKLTALEREVHEETGVNLKGEQVNFVTTCYVRYEAYDFLYHIYRTILNTPPAIVIREKEHTDHQWLAPNDALKLNLIQDEDFCIKLLYHLT